MLAFICMLHGNNHFSGTYHQIHGTSHTRQHFSRNFVIGDIAFFIYLKRAEDCYIHMAAANNGK